VRWGRVRAWWWEVLLNGLLEGVIAWEAAELLLWSSEWEYDEKEGKSAYVSGLVHVNPSSVDIEPCSRVVEELEFICPVPSQRQ
jgi:hypothetical protein